MIGNGVDRTLRAILAADCGHAVPSVLDTRRVSIIGYGAGSWLAGLLEHNLDSGRDDVRLLANFEGSSCAACTMTRLPDADLVIAVAFPRYFKDTFERTRHARERGVRVLALTDRQSSPLAPLATVALHAHTRSPSFTNSEVSALAPVAALSCAVLVRAEAALKPATDLADAVLL